MGLALFGGRPRVVVTAGDSVETEETGVDRELGEGRGLLGEAPLFCCCWWVGEAVEPRMPLTAARS